MHIQRIVLDNVRCHKHLELDLFPGVVCILGRNGAGKSSIAQALGWALFDHLPYKQAQFIRSGAENANVLVQFEHDGKIWIVERSTEKGTQVQCVGSGVMAVGVRDSFSVIRRAMGVSPDKNLPELFKNALAPAQGEIMNGLDLSPKARQSYWAKVLGLGLYQKAWETLRGPQRQIEKEMAQADGQCSALTASIAAFTSQKTRAQLESELGQLVQALGDALAHLKMKEAELEDARIRVGKQALLERVREQMAKAGLDVETSRVYADVQSQAVKKQAQIEKELDTLKTAAERYQSARVAVSRIEAVVEQMDLASQVSYEEWRRSLRRQQEGEAASADLFSAQFAVTAKEKAWQKAQANYLLAQTAADQQAFIQETGQCPVCRTDVGVDHVLVQVGDLATCLTERGRTETEHRKAQALERQLSVQVENAPSEQEVAQLAAIVGDGALAKEAQQKALQAEMATVLASGDQALRYKDLMGKRQDAASAYQRAQADYQSNVQRVKELQTEVAQLEIVSQGALTDVEMRQLTEQEAALRRDISQVEKDKFALEQALEGLKKVEGLQARLQMLTQELARLKMGATFLEECRQAYRGLGPLVAEGVMKSILVLVSQYWAAMGKSGILQWSPSFEVSLDGQPYPRLSGGEKVAAALACRMAVACWQAQLNWALLDEPTIHLDQAARGGLSDLLGQLGLEQLIVITHNEELAATATQTVTL